MPSHLASDVDMMRHSYDQWALGERERALAYYHKPDPDVDMLMGGQNPTFFDTRCSDVAAIST